MKKSPYPSVSDPLWTAYVETLDKETEASLTAEVNALYNSDNQPALSVYEIEGRKVAMRWGMRAARKRLEK